MPSFETLQGETDFRTILTKIPEVDTVVVFSYGEIAYLLKERRELGIQTGVYAFETIKDPRTIEVAGEEAMEGILFSYPGEANTKKYREFVEMYNRKYGGDPPIYAFKAYDAVHLLYRAIEDCNYKRKGICIKRSLEKVKNYEGASNNMTFDIFGDLVEETFHTERFNKTWIVEENLFLSRST